MELIFTKKASYLKKWDAFIGQSRYANHLQFSDWLQSYKSYGFDFEVCLLMDKGIIVGGYGAVISKFSIFKFYSIPNGPIVRDFNNEEVIQTIILAISKRAVALKCCYCQFNLSLAIGKNEQVSDLFLSENNFKKGSLFKYVYASEGIN